MTPLDSFFLEGHWYRPHMLPVDYTGTVVFRLSIYLEDGTYLERSTLQTAEEDGPDSEAAIGRALALLEAACQTARGADGLLPKDEFIVKPR